MATEELQIIWQQAEKLSPVEKVEIIKRLADSLIVAIGAPRASSKQLIYGEFRDYPGQPTNEKDFKLAEWHPTDEENSG